MLALRLDCSTAALTTPQKVLSISYTYHFKPLEVFQSKECSIWGTLVKMDSQGSISDKECNARATRLCHQVEVAQFL